MMPTRKELSFAVALLGLFYAAGSSSLEAQDARQGWNFDPKTSAVVLTAVESSEALTTFSFKNVSERVISAFAVAFGANSRNRTNRYQDWFGAEPAGLSPGEVFNLTIGTREALSFTDRTLQIAAVIFEEGAGEGSSSHIRFLNSRRIGQMLETEHVRKILGTQESLRMDDEGIKALTRKVGSLPETNEEAFESLEGTHLPDVEVQDLRLTDAGTLTGFLAGVRLAREDALHMIDKLQELPESSSDSGALTRAIVLFRLQQMYEEKSARHHSFLDRTRGAKNQ